MQEEPMDIHWNQTSKPGKEQFSLDIPELQEESQPEVKDEVQNDWGANAQLDDLDLDELELDAFEVHN